METKSSGKGGQARKLSALRGDFSDGKVRLLIVRSFIDSLGTGIYLAGSAIFFTRQVGLSAVQVGTGLSIASVVGLLAVVPSGLLAEKIGTRKTLLIFDIWRMAGFVGYTFIHSFWYFIILVSLLSIPEQAVNPLTQHLVEQVVGERARIKTMAKLRTVYNIGFTIGAPLTAIAFKFDTTLAYDSLMLGDALTFLLAMVILLRLREVVRLPASRLRLSSERRPSVAAIRDRRYMSAAAINSIMSLHLSLLTVGIPLWISLHTDVPRLAVGPLVAINTVLSVLLQIPVAARSETVTASITMMRISGAALAVCCVLLALAAKLPLVAALAALASAMVLQTVAEITQASAGWTFSYALAPTADRAQCLTTFGLSISAQFVFGPPLLTGLVIANGSFGWVGLAIAFVACAFIVRAVIGPDNAASEPGSTESGTARAQ